MERKEFIKQFGLLVGGSLLFSLDLLSKNNQKDNAQTWKQLVDYAKWSPSPHNIQPWKIKVISGNEAELFYVPERLIPVSDADNKFMTIALGIFIENLSIAATGFSYELIFEHYGKPVDDTKCSETAFGKLFLQKRNEIEIKFDKELILQRKTSRLHYQPKAVKEDILNRLNTVAAKFDHTFLASSNEDVVKAIIKLNCDTLFYDLNNDPVREELDRWLRYTNEQAQTKKDGLWYHCMRFPGKLMRNFFHNHTFYNHGLVKKVIDKYYLNSMDNTKTIAWINGNISNTYECVKTGRMLAQLWLEMTKHNVYMHPFGSVITNPNAHSQLKNIINAQDDTWFLLRMGYSDIPPKSYRLETDELFIK